MNSTAAIIVIAIAAAIIALLLIDANRAAKRVKAARDAEEILKENHKLLLQKLKADYNQTLQGLDKKAALDAGRKYYGTLRGGKLTLYDEQAITNDLSAMQ